MTQRNKKILSKEIVMPSNDLIWKKFLILKGKEIGSFVGVVGAIFLLGPIGKFTWNLFGFNSDCSDYQTGLTNTEPLGGNRFNPNCSGFDGFFWGLLSLAVLAVLVALLVYFIRMNWRKASVQAFEEENPKFEFKYRNYENKYDSLQDLQKNTNKVSEVLYRK